MRRNRNISFFENQGGYTTVDPTGRAVRRGRRIVVREWEQGLVFRHGRLDAVVGPGAHRRWSAQVSVRTVDLRPWVVFVPTQEVPTADGVPVKVTVTGRARVLDASTFVTASRDPEHALYFAIQVTLREIVGGASTEELLAARGELGERLVAGLRGIDELGIEVEQLELKDIVLPGELKRAQTEVLVARAQGAAALERARGETAALRSLANAARAAADNPALLQLRLVQQLDASSGHTVVLGAPALGITPAPT